MYEDRKCKSGKVCKGKGEHSFASKLGWCASCLIEDGRCSFCEEKFSAMPNEPPWHHIPGLREDGTCWNCQIKIGSSYIGMKRKGIV